MSVEYVSLQGEQVNPENLLIPKARDLAQALLNNVSTWARFVACERMNENGLIAALQGAEVVIFDVDVEVPQKKQHDIRRVEQIAVAFWQADTSYPETLALRADFPVVPHINVRSFEIPRSLCLYEIPYDEVKLHWTAAGFVEDIRGWLARTAEGTLHADDQQLEPFFLANVPRIVFPSDFISSHSSYERLSISRVDNDQQICLIAERAEDGNQNSRMKKPENFVAITAVGAPQVHGAAQRQPRNLSELHKFMETAGIDLCAVLRQRLRDWQEDKALRNATPIIIVILPKQREANGPVEDWELWAFFCARVYADEQLGTENPSNDISFLNVLQLGEELDLWQNKGGHLATVVVPDLSKHGEQVRLSMLNPSFMLSRETAARLNGQPDRYGRKIVAVGMGALGSQVFLNLIRSAYGEWTIIDNDIMLPHNSARHGLYGHIVGYSKVAPLAFIANETIDGSPIAKAIVADVQHPGTMDDDVKRSFYEASEILDFSASVAVGRHLSFAVSSTARRASFFLNPTGTDSVMLVEDVNRQVPLNALEMQYYRLLVHEIDLHSHLRPPAERIRYARSCRDLSSTISQEHVALHAAIGARALRKAFESDGGIISVWRTSHEGGVYPVSISPSPLVTIKKKGWQICADQVLLESVRQFREQRLPAETGGILIGAVDHQYRIVYVVDALPAPPDSSEELTGFVRGSHRLTEALEQIEEITAKQLTYVGEWHSHPTGSSVRPSKLDRNLLKWLTDKMTPASLPAVMLIVGGRGQYAWYIG